MTSTSLVNRASTLSLGHIFNEPIVSQSLHVIGDRYLQDGGRPHQWFLKSVDDHLRAVWGHSAAQISYVFGGRQGMGMCGHPHKSAELVDRLVSEPRCARLIAPGAVTFFIEGGSADGMQHASALTSAKIPFMEEPPAPPRYRWPFEDLLNPPRVVFGSASDLARELIEAQSPLPQYRDFVPHGTSEWNRQTRERAWHVATEDVKMQRRRLLWVAERIATVALAGHPFVDLGQGMLIHDSDLADFSRLMGISHYHLSKADDSRMQTDNDDLPVFAVSYGSRSQALHESSLRPKSVARCYRYDDQSLWVPATYWPLHMPRDLVTAEVTANFQLHIAGSVHLASDVIEKLPHGAIMLFSADNPDLRVESGRFVHGGLSSLKRDDVVVGTISYAEIQGSRSEADDDADPASQYLVNIATNDPRTTHAIVHQLVGKGADDRTDSDVSGHAVRALEWGGELVVKW